MGRRGPPPLPTAVKERRGTLEKSRQVSAEMPGPPGAPVMPAWLDEVGRAEWSFIVPKLAEAGVLSTLDASALGRYCAAHSLEVAATLAYQRDGVCVETPFGPKTHPMVKVAREARAQANLLGGKFGLSPSDRTRVSVPEAPKKDADEDFLFGGLQVVPGGKGG